MKCPSCYKNCKNLQPDSDMCFTCELVNNYFIMCERAIVQQLQDKGYKVNINLKLIVEHTGSQISKKDKAKKQAEINKLYE